MVAYVRNCTLSFCPVISSCLRMSTPRSTNLFQLHQGTAEHLRKASEKDLEVCQGESFGPQYYHKAKKRMIFKFSPAIRRNMKKKLHSDPALTAKKLKQPMTQLETTR